MIICLIVKKLIIQNARINIKIRFIANLLFLIIISFIYFLILLKRFSIRLD